MLKLDTLLLNEGRIIAGKYTPAIDTPDTPESDKRAATLLLHGDAGDITLEGDAARIVFEHLSTKSIDLLKTRPSSASDGRTQLVPVSPRAITTLCEAFNQIVIEEPDGAYKLCNLIGVLPVLSKEQKHLLRAARTILAHLKNQAGDK